MPATDIFNDAFNQLVTKLQTIPNITVVDDPRNINPPCVFVDAPTIEMETNVVAKMNFNVRVIGSGPGDLKTLQTLLTLADKVRQLQIGLSTLNPSITTIGALDYASYELSISTKIAP